MNEVENVTSQLFENIKHIDDEGTEYWLQENYKEFLDIRDGESLMLLLKKQKSVAKTLEPLKRTIVSSWTKWSI